MYPLNIPLIFYTITLYLDIKDFIQFSISCKDLKVLYDDDNLWKLKYFKNDVDIKSYKDYIIKSFLKRSNNICMLCYKLLITNIIITMHNCNYALKKCINCNNIKCKCTGLTYYHQDCLDIKKFGLFKCPLCSEYIKGYFVSINI